MVLNECNTESFQFNASPISANGLLHFLAGKMASSSSQNIEQDGLGVLPRRAFLASLPLKAVGGTAGEGFPGSRLCTGAGEGSHDSISKAALSGICVGGSSGSITAVSSSSKALSFSTGSSPILSSSLGL